MLQPAKWRDSDLAQLNHWPCRVFRSRKEDWMWQSPADLAPPRLDPRPPIWSSPALKPRPPMVHLPQAPALLHALLTSARSCGSGCSTSRPILLAPE